MRPCPGFLSTPHAGTFVIASDSEGRWALGFETEALDSHLTPEDAAEAVARGHCRWPSVGNPAALGIPCELKRWVVINSGPAAARTPRPLLRVVK